MDDGRIVERFRTARHDPELVVLEGFHALKHAARFGAEILEVAVRDPENAARLARELAPDAARLVTAAARVEPDVFARLAPRPHPTGVVALARRPAVSLERLLDAPGPAPIVLLEDARRAENVGAVVRVAAAAGAAGVVALGGADPWAPAAVRGAAGLHFALPVARAALADVLGGDEGARGAGGRPLVALDPEGAPLGQGTIPPRALIAFGTERAGLSRELLARADQRIAITMRAGVSSLNLATAVAVALYSRRIGAAGEAE